MSTAPTGVEGRPSDKAGGGEAMGTSYLTRPCLRQPHDFNTGRCSCNEDWRNCLDTFFCWYGIVTTQFNTADKELKSGPFQCSYCCAVCVADLFTGGCASLACVGMTRAKIRQGFGMSMEMKPIFIDFICGLCCTCTMACQNHREMHMRGYFAEGCYEKPRHEWLYPSGGSVLEPQPSLNPEYSQQQQQQSCPAYVQGGGNAHYDNGGVACEPQPQPY